MSVPRDVARLCIVQFLEIQIARSIMPVAGSPVRSESIRLVVGSVGLRCSEINGHFSSHLCPQRCSPTLCHPVSRNPDRKIEHDSGGQSCTIQINTIGCRFGRAASLGDRRPHLSSHLCPQRCSPTMCRPVSRNPDRKIDHDNGGQSWRKAGVNANIFKSTFRRPRRPAIESFFNPMPPSLVYLRSASSSSSFAALLILS